MTRDVLLLFQPAGMPRIPTPVSNPDRDSDPGSNRSITYPDSNARRVRPDRSRRGPYVPSPSPRLSAGRAHRISCVGTCQDAGPRRRAAAGRLDADRLGSVQPPTRVVDHHVLGLHHVRPGPGQLAYDIGFLVFGLLLVVVGLRMSRNRAAGRTCNQGCAVDGFLVVDDQPTCPAGGPHQRSQPELTTWNGLSTRTSLGS
jgi:hypothetical protein